MGIKEFLKNVETHVAREFVSVKTLIEVLSEEQRCSKSEAAKFLVLNIKHYEKVMPDLHVVDAELLTVQKEICVDVLWPLREIISSNSFSDDSNLYGWMRSDLLPFLRSTGLDNSIIFPTWQPTEVLDCSPASNSLKSSSKSTCETAANREGGHVEIKGDLYSSLQRAIRAFPIQFPDYKKKMPMAKVVKNWIKDSGIETTDRPAQVLSTMVIENFSTDT